MGICCCLFQGKSNTSKITRKRNIGLNREGDSPKMVGLDKTLGSWLEGEGAGAMDFVATVRLLLQRRPWEKRVNLSYSVVFERYFHRFPRFFHDFVKKKTPKHSSCSSIGDSEAERRLWRLGTSGGDPPSEKSLGEATGWSVGRFWGAMVRASCGGSPFWNAEQLKNFSCWPNPRDLQTVRLEQKKRKQC